MPQQLCGRLASFMMSTCWSQATCSQLPGAGEEEGGADAAAGHAVWSCRRHRRDFRHLPPGSRAQAHDDGWRKGAELLLLHTPPALPSPLHTSRNRAVPLHRLVSAFAALESCTGMHMWQADDDSWLSNARVVRAAFLPAYHILSHTACLC